MKKDGTQLDIELSIAKVNLHGKWYAVGVMRDISERKKTEQKLKEKMEELERMNTLMIGRELKMVELKNENNQLKEKLGKV
jgi:cell shape-determining protein MreC